MAAWITRSFDAPDAGSAGTVRTQVARVAAAGFEFENGARVPSLRMAFETYGELAPDGRNAILVLHGSTGSGHAAGRHGPNDAQPGWADGLIGPGKVFDTNRYFIVAPNRLCGSFGSDGPNELDPTAERRYGFAFPVTSIRDMARADRALLEHLGVRGLAMVYGVSMGGFQAAEWAMMFPGFAERIVIDRGNFRSPDLLVATTEARTLAIRSDPDWRGGRYAEEGVFPTAGMTIAGMILQLYATSQEAFTMAFGRAAAEGWPSPYAALEGRFAAAQALREAGETFAAGGIDPNAYLYNIRAIALHDVSHGHGSLDAAAARVRARVRLFHCRSDLLVPVEGARDAQRALRGAGVDSELYEYDHPFGHLALSTPELRARWLPVLADFLNDRRG
jgi:homoserine O-acetyltransferase/O-succinyltransferase